MVRKAILLNSAKFSKAVINLDGECNALRSLPLMKYKKENHEHTIF